MAPSDSIYITAYLMAYLLYFPPFKDIRKLNKMSKVWLWKKMKATTTTTTTTTIYFYSQSNSTNVYSLEAQK